MLPEICRECGSQKLAYQEEEGRDYLYCLRCGLILGSLEIVVLEEKVGN